MQLPHRKPGKHNYSDTDPVITTQKYNALVKKLENLKRAKPHAMAEVSRLAELGDFSENVEYQLAKGRLRSINNNILKLQTQLDHAEVIEPDKNTGRVSLGHTVTIEKEGQEKTYTILGGSETDPAKNIISHNSPIGAALMGKKVGDVVRVEIGGREVQIKIIGIKK